MELASEGQEHNGDGGVLGEEITSNVDDPEG